MIISYQLLVPVNHSILQCILENIKKVKIEYMDGDMRDELKRFNYKFLRKSVKVTFNWFLLMIYSRRASLSLTHLLTRSQAMEISKLVV